MTTHSLKTWPSEFEAVRSGVKRFELRDERDRDYATGDVLLLRLWDPQRRLMIGFPTGTYVSANDRAVADETVADTIRARVTYVLHGGRFGLQPGMCVMSIELEQTP